MRPSRWGPLDASGTLESLVAKTPKLAVVVGAVGTAGADFSIGARLDMEPGLGRGTGVTLDVVAVREESVAPARES